MGGTSKRGMKYRSRDGIINAILVEIDRGRGNIRITEIMYRVFLSHYQLKKYITKLKLAGLVTDDNGRYRITLKGIQLLHVYKQMEEVIPTINQPKIDDVY